MYKQYDDIHFEEITEVEEKSFVNDNDRQAIMYPKKYAVDLMRKENKQGEENNEASIEEAKK